MQLSFTRGILGYRKDRVMVGIGRTASPKDPCEWEMMNPG